MTRSLLAGDRVLWPDQTFAPGWLAIEDGRLVASGRGPAPGPVDLAAPVLAPGLVDQHCHGGGGHTFATLDADEAVAAVRSHRAHGATSVVASLVTAPVPVLIGQLQTLVPLVAAGELAGLHLEGPWLSPQHRGAHDPALLLEPTPGDVDALLAAAEGHLSMVTLAPELPGAAQAISRLTAAGVRVAVGHTDADETQLAAAADAGARVVTHLCNAMRPIHHRRPGPVPAALEDPRWTVEVIADGVHLHPHVVSLIFRAAQSRVALITDAMAAAGCADGAYRLGALPVTVRDGVARLDDTGSIAGSTLTLDAAVRAAVAAGIAPERALRSATEVPADAMGLPAGRLSDGAAADVVALDDGLVPLAVWRAGQPV